MFKGILFLLLLGVVSTPIYAAPGEASGTISRIIVKESGYVLVYFQQPHANPTQCVESNVVAIAQDHIAKKEMLSVAMLSKAMGRVANFWVNDCYAAYGTTFPLGITAAIN